jgi:hypothetical protein
MVHIFAGDRPSFDLKMLKILIQRGGRNQFEEKRTGMTPGRLANSACAFSNIRFWQHCPLLN